MANTIKINSRFTKKSITGESDIYRKFSYQFEQLFNSEDPSRDNEEFEKLYVADAKMEEQLERFRTSANHMAKFCVGYTGMGKSTVIRHCFSLGTSNVPRINLERKEIIFPTCLDGYPSTQKHINLCPHISSVCSLLEKENPDLRAYLQTIDGKKEFFEFVRIHTPFAVEKSDPTETIDMSELEYMNYKLKYARKKSPFQYQANLLKFYIMRHYEKYNRLIIILDDIESLPEDFQKDAIAQFLKLFKCMQNTDYPTDKNYNINLLISVRPHTYRRNINSRKLETFSVSAPIFKSEPVDIKQLFDNRFEYYTRTNSKPIGEITTWEQCRAELNKLNLQFKSQYSEMISNLSFMNVRKILANYSIIFSNRFWVQRSKPKEDAFTISEREYYFNNVNVIRALACHENEVFFEDDDKDIVANIFFTTEHEDYSIMCLFAIKYFLKKTFDEEYGYNVETLENVKQFWEELFGSPANSLMDVVGFLFEKGILRKSINNFKDGTEDDKKDSLNENSMLYISPKGKELYSMLERDSVLLEMLRETVWRDYENRDDYSAQSTNELMQQGQQRLVFLDLIEYIDYLCEKEDDMLSIVKYRRKAQTYKDVLDKTPLCQQLIKGLRKSLIYTGLIQDSDIYQKYRQLDAKVNSLMAAFE